MLPQQCISIGYLFFCCNFVLYIVMAYFYEHFISHPSFGKNGWYGGFYVRGGDFLEKTRI